MNRPLLVAYLEALYEADAITVSIDSENVCWVWHGGDVLEAWRVDTEERAS